MTIEELKDCLSPVTDEILYNDYYKIDKCKIGDGFIMIDTTQGEVGNDYRFLIKEFRKKNETSIKILTGLINAISHINGHDYNVDFRIEVFMRPNDSVEHN